MNYPVPANEVERLAALHDLRILDTPPSRGFDRICEMVRDLLDLPIAVVSLMDSDRQWFKARCGIDADGTSRESAFCSYTLMSDATLVVPDAKADERFAQNPIVNGGPEIRFYAGVPLSLRPGLRLGTLCAMDRMPREFNDHQRRQLEGLAVLAVDQLRLHRAIGRLRATLGRERRSRRELDRQGRELRRREAMLAQTERMAHVAGWEVDLATQKVTWSDEVYRMSGLPIDREITLEQALSFYPEPERRTLIDILADTIERRGAFDLKLPYRSLSGGPRWVHLMGEVEVVDGRATKLMGVVQDITERRSAEAQMWHLANHDPLTNLPHRALFHERLDLAIRESLRSGRKTALMLIDLDFFKEINDAYGHDAGDTILRSFAARMSESVRVSDTVARLGGDEFAVILTGLSADGDIDVVLARLQAQLDRPVNYRGDLLSCRASIGIALCPDHDSEATQLLRDADFALYSAKAAGRARAVRFSSMIRQARDHRIAAAIRVRSALAADAVFPHYQPVVCIDTGRVIGFEALLRWRHPVEGLKDPGSILAAFEDSELAFALSDRILSRMIGDMRRWLDDGLDFGRIGFNVSEIEFRRGDLAVRLLDRLTRAGIPPSRLVVEVTETVLLGKDLAAAKAQLDALRQGGIAIALDDFGTGYASLTHLRQIPVDIIKIDRSFIKDVTRQHESSAIVSAVVGLCRSLSIELVAEGIETCDQLTFLRERGSLHGQGYLFQKAMAADRLPAFLRSWGARWARIDAVADAA